LVTPRHSRPFDGQDLLQYHQVEMAHAERSQRTTLWVCVTAGVILGIGLSLLVSGNNKRKRTEPHCGRDGGTRATQ
jgi:formate/nitrite transporter FocA (FNT family)